MSERESTQLDTLAGPPGGTQTPASRPGARASAPGSAPAAPAAPAASGSTPDELAPGVVFDDRLRLEACIGAGAMGEIWRARHLGLDSDVAIKFVGEALRERASAMERFWLEARTMGRMGHPNVVRVLDTSSPTAPVPYIVMELLDGEPLDAFMERGLVGPEDAKRIGAGILAALGEAHRNAIVHRDIKPANVFLGRDPDKPDAVKVLDFGASKLLDSGDMRLTQAGALVGTPLYMSPEQASGEPVTHRSDLYAAAVVVYEMLSGRLPHEADDLRALIIRRSTMDATPIRELMPELDPAYASFFDRALEREPENRFDDAESMRQALLELPDRSGPSSGLSLPSMASRAGVPDPDADEPEPEAGADVQAWGAAFEAVVGAAESRDDVSLSDVGEAGGASASMSINQHRPKSSIVGPAGQNQITEAALELDHGETTAARPIPVWMWAAISVLAAAAAYGVWSWRAGSDAPGLRATIDAALAFVSVLALGGVAARLR